MYTCLAAPGPRGVSLQSSCQTGPRLSDNTNAWSLIRLDIDR